MNNAIVHPTLKFYKFYNVPLAREIRRQAELTDVEWHKNSLGPSPAYHGDLKPAPWMDQTRTWLQSCLDAVTQEDLPENLTCAVTEMWLTKSQQHNQIHKHTHQLSVYSGVFYLQDSPGGTDFEITPWYFEKWPQMILPFAKKSMIKYHSPCKEGHLIIFPSHIWHSTQALDSEQTRYSLAFNSFWNGCLSRDRSVKLTVHSTD